MSRLRSASATLAVGLGLAMAGGRVELSRSSYEKVVFLPVATALLVPRREAAQTGPVPAGLWDRPAPTGPVPGVRVAMRPLDPLPRLFTGPARVTIRGTIAVVLAMLVVIGLVTSWVEGCADDPWEYLVPYSAGGCDRFAASSLLVATLVVIPFVAVLFALYEAWPLRRDRDA